MSSSDDIASQLLHSSDARIAEAAKRVFSASYPTVASLSSTTLSTVDAAARYPSFHHEELAVNGFDVSDDWHAVGNDAAHAEAGAPLGHIMSEQQHTAAINSPLDLHSHPNEDMDYDHEGDDKKTSSTERLQRSGRPSWCDKFFNTVSWAGQLTLWSSTSVF
eukprot:scaffold1201_cov199-Alexandrium_tamarense.AAC.21